MNVNNNLVELQVLNKIIIDQDFGDFKDKLLPNYFNYPYDKMYQYLEYQEREYKKIPSAIDMAAEFDSDWETVIVDTPVDKLIDDMLERALYKEGMHNVFPKLQDNLNLFADCKSDEGMRGLIETLKIAEDVYYEIKEKKRQNYSSFIQSDVFTKPEDFEFLPTGFPEIDRDCEGLSTSGDLCLMLARTGTGKSWALCQTAAASFMIGKNVGLITIEMSKPEILMRLHTIVGHFSNRKMQKFEIACPEDYIDSLKKHDNDMFVFDMNDLRGNLTIETIEDVIVRHNLDILIIDGITYITDINSQNELFRVVLRRIAGDLMTLSQKRHVPIICSVQANRNGVSNDGTPPGVDTISESDGIALAATKILSLGKNGNRVKIQIVKNRLTEVGTVYEYDWDYDTGNIQFVEKYDSGVNSERTAGTRETVENRQPITRQDHDWQTPPSRRSIARPKI